MNSTAAFLALHGLTSDHILELAFSSFASVLFLQSGMDKLFNWKAEKDYFTEHFSKSILNGSVPLLLPVITLMETSAGLLCAVGFGQVLFTGNTGIGTAGMICAITAITMLFFGQRVSKDYKGAAVLVPYFLMAALGLFVFVAG